MKSRIPKIISSLLALLVMVSTVSWTVDKHLCMGRVMDVSFFHEADSCGMEEAMAIMGKTMEDNPCCGDESFTIEGQDELSISWDELDIDAQKFLVAYTHSYLKLLSDTPQKQVVRSIYPPPLLVYDLNVLHETFLI